MVISWPDLVVDNELNAELFEEIMLFLNKLKVEVDSYERLVVFNYPLGSKPHLYPIITKSTEHLLASFDNRDVQIPFDIKLKYF